MLDLREKVSDVEAQERICKIRNRPIEVIHDTVFIGINQKPLVIPKGCKGYVIDYPEVFCLTDKHREVIETCPERFLPAIFLGYEDVVYLSEDDVKVIPPFFDMILASAFCLEVDKDAST